MDRLRARDPLGVHGTAYRDAGGIVVNAARGLVEDLDTIPFPAWDLIPMHRYVASTWFPNKVKQFTNIFTSRGCPYGCTFCGAKTTWTRRFRARSPENVVAEMEEVYRRFGIPNFFISDDLFTLKRKRVMEICTLILERALPITWTCLSRVNTVDPEMLALMKKAGCYLISYGLESGSQAGPGQARQGHDGGAGHQGRRDDQGRWHQGVRLVHDRIAGRDARDGRSDDQAHQEDEARRGRAGRDHCVPGHGPVRHLRVGREDLDWDKALAFNPSAADHSDVFLKCTDLDDEQIRRLFHKAMREAVLYNPRLLVRRLSHLGFGAPPRAVGEGRRQAVH